jgi:hypothetical protein
VQNSLFARKQFPVPLCREFCGNTRNSLSKSHRFSVLSQLDRPSRSRGCHFVSKVAVGLIVTAVLLLTGRERLHTMARQLELPEVVTAGKFLILTGIILPLLAGPRGHKPAMP